MASLLFDGRFAPLTNVVGFIETPLDTCAGAFTRIVARRLGVPPERLRRQPAPGPLERAVALALPTRDRPTGDRFLLAPTAGSWTAFLENGATGGDPREAVEELPDELGCRTASVYAVPATDGRGFDVLGFTLAAPGRAGPLDAVRVLILNRVAGDTEVQSYGEPLPGERDPADLDLDGLDRVLRPLGLRPFDADFYLPPGMPGILLSQGAGA